MQTAANKWGEEIIKYRKHKEPKIYKGEKNNKIQGKNIQGNTMLNGNNEIQRITNMQGNEKMQNNAGN